MVTPDDESLRLAYWKSLQERARESAPELVVEEPQPGPTLVFPIGLDDFQIIVIINLRVPERLAVAIDCKGDSAYRNLLSLEARRVEFQGDLGLPLEVVSHRKNAVLRLKTSVDGNYKEQADWDRQFEWALGVVRQFKEYFPPILRGLDRNDLDE